MKLVGHGIDIVDIPELKKHIDLPGGHFLSRTYTARELEDVGDDLRRYERLAGRYAVKEAVAKAVGVGWGDGYGWSDIEVLTGDSGAPYVELSDRARERFGEVANAKIFVSVSHTELFAIASVIAVSE